MTATFHRVVAWSRLDRLLRLFIQYPVITLCVPAFLGLATQPLVRCCSEFMNVYVGSARVLLDGGDIYTAGHGYAYPPLAALLAVPFVVLPESLARLAWYFVNVGAMLSLLHAAWNMAGGKPLGSLRATARREWFAFGLGLVWLAPYLLNALAHEQTDVVIAALLTIGCYLMLRGHAMVGAALVGLSATFKGPTLLFLGYLIFRRRWRAAGLALAVAIGANLVPDVVDHPSRGTLLGEWVTRLVLPRENFSVPLGSWNGTLYNLSDQSLGGTLQRLVNTTVSWSSGAFAMEPRAVMVGPAIMRTTAYSLMLLMAAISAWAALRGERQRGGERPLPGMPNRTAIEMGAMMALVLMMSPMSAPAHYGLLAAPMLCFTRLALVGRYRMASAVISIGILAALAMNADLVGRPVYYFALWTGMTTWSAIGLWIGGTFLLANGALQDDAQGAHAAVAHRA